MEVQAHVMKCKLSYIGQQIIMRGLVILYAEYLLCELSVQSSDRVNYS